MAPWPELQIVDHALGTTQAAFKAAVEDWRGLPEEQKRMYTQQASQLAEAAQVLAQLTAVPHAACTTPYGTLFLNPPLTTSLVGARKPHSRADLGGERVT